MYPIIPSLLIAFCAIIYVIIKYKIISIVMDYITSLYRSYRTPVLISVEGNIGVGKSTLLAMLTKDLGDMAEFITEPVELWESVKDDNGKNMLEVFYDDKTRWSYTFQNVAYVTRMDLIVRTSQKTKKPLIIMDRSLSADREVFARMLYDNGNMNALEWNAYGLWNDFYDRTFKKNKRNNIVYLKCSPQVAYQRIMHRSRNGESTISLAYLESVDDYHRTWLEQNKNNDNILVIDCDKDFVEDKARYEEILSQIKQFV